MKFTVIIPAIFTGLATAGIALAAVSPEQAEKLKTTLTPLGAEKAGSQDGAIPAWTGGYTKVPEGYVNGQPRPDPFANEKPLYTITHANMERYADRLTDGEKALLGKYPDFSMEIYPTHRTEAAPQWVYDNTFKNATRAELTSDGNGVSNAYGGIPFPIPQSGAEAIWNNRLSWLGESFDTRFRAYVMNNNGARYLSSGGTRKNTFPYYWKGRDLAGFHSHLWSAGVTLVEEPNSSAGQAVQQREPMDYIKQVRDIWLYLVGQRRVRRAAQFAYDLPNFVEAGQGFVDTGFMLFGPQDEYQFALLGKKEMYVPYNDNRAYAVSSGKLLTPRFLNPDLVRWELHRVWVVDGKLKPGRRHVVPHRRYYLDEDSWQILWIDGWDAQGKLWKANYNLPLLAPDMPGITNQLSWGTYDLQNGYYIINMASNGDDGPLTPQYKLLPPLPLDDFSADALAAKMMR
ncbi:MAG: DUF1329 domain-containing protein [Gammaproteobacteria bacterium]|nr:DUF1329 domain-containing protein [Gammaproteobacteria bacterium]